MYYDRPRRCAATLRCWTAKVPVDLLEVAQLLEQRLGFRGDSPRQAGGRNCYGYGYPESAIVPTLLAECVLVALYLVPQNAVLAAI